MVALLTSWICWMHFWINHCANVGRNRCGNEPIILFGFGYAAIQAINFNVVFVAAETYCSVTDHFLLRPLVKVNFTYLLQLTLAVLIFSHSVTSHILVTQNQI